MVSSLSPVEQSRLGQIRPELRADLLALRDAAFTELGFLLEVPADGGTRTLERQQQLYDDSIAQGGGTLAYPVGQPGKSRHNYGAAFDVHIVAGGTAADGTGTDNDYQELGALAESLAGAPGLKAGYYFAERGQGMSDPYHFQLNEPLADSQAKASIVSSAGGFSTTDAIALALVAAIGVMFVKRRRS